MTRHGIRPVSTLLCTSAYVGLVVSRGFAYDSLTSLVILSFLNYPEMMDERGQHNHIRAAFMCTCTPFKGNIDLTTAVHESR